MRLLAVVALLMLLPLTSWGDESKPAVGTSPSQMIENSCPPPLPMPEAMANGLGRMLNPGKMDADAQTVFGRPEVQSYLQATQERARTDWPNLCRYRALNASQTRPVRAVFMGDSITEFWAQADPALFSNSVVGRGISGQTSRRCCCDSFRM